LSRYGWFMPQFPIESMRERFLAYVSDQGVNIEEPLRESLLIQNGSFFGRRMALHGFQIVWFAEEDHVKLYNPLTGLVFSGPTRSWLDSGTTSQVA